MTTPHTDPSLISRRKFITYGAVAAAIGTASFYGLQRDRDYTLKSVRTMMGTYVNFTIIGQDKQSCDEALAEAVAHMELQGKAINMYIPDSPLSKLNREGVLENADPTLVQVVTMAKEMAELTRGAFDPTVLPLLGLYREMKNTGILPPREKIDEALALVSFTDILVEGSTLRFAKPGMGITLDAIGKGFVVDEGVRKLNELGFSSVMVEAGGDLMVTGAKTDGSPWTVAIRSPRPDRGGEQLMVKMQNRAIATSGDYMQSFTEDHKYHHIINPKTGFSSPELASSSILAPTVAMADGLATATMVMGPEKSIALLNTLPACEGYLIGKDLSTYSSKDFFS